MHRTIWQVDRLMVVWPVATQKDSPTYTKELQEAKSTKEIPNFLDSTEDEDGHPNFARPCDNLRLRPLPGLCGLTGVKCRGNRLFSGRAARFPRERPGKSASADMDFLVLSRLVIRTA